MPQSAVHSLDPARFVAEYLQPGFPVVVRDALAGWASAPPWDLAALGARFGGHRVPLYDTLFSLQTVSTLGEYVASYTDRSTPTPGGPPYLRWFTRQSRDRMPWADEAFAQLADDWTMPSWLPDSDYVFPRLPGAADPTRDAFPARGLFVCGTGGRTRLHVDPWASDACLCQITGSKRFVMYPPEAAALLSDRTGALVDLEEPDDERFPRWRSAQPAFEEVVGPGDAIFIPAGWHHAAVALSDSISLTWNFVHRTHERRFAEYLRAGGSTDPIVAYFRSAALRKPPAPPAAAASPR